ncbi:nucleoside triphosphate pyrophosphohydrolase [Virgisporangium aliadipatigenens]|uniref:Nucleoside triphosphate pyrophosphohydrolase n=1 Tax=Virgisporangium aliadipatigenens TaxID=741659 RepID=A0A8J3YGT1_9ACTN|nr:nucleoside triphosphate pyrophosphohydrolase [Virgisporangium aliadipatigenens]
MVLLVTSPRLPAGLLTAEAWDVVRAFPVYTAADSAQVTALRFAGAVVSVGGSSAEELLAAAREHGTAVWLASPDGDQDLARAIGMRVARQPDLAELELLYGSWDPPGARLLEAVDVMARLVAPDGDPWKRAQTPRSLAPYLLEEAYEAYDAILSGDPDALREELGDVLLQVVLHAGLSENAGGWNIDDVAGGLVEKLIRRNPHVFAGLPVEGIDEITANWEQIKKAEKSRKSAFDGMVLAQPALSLAAKALQRAERAGLAEPVPAPSTVDGDGLLGIVALLREQGADAEALLREATLRWIDRARAAETD